MFRVSFRGEEGYFLGLSNGYHSTIAIARINLRKGRKGERNGLVARVGSTTIKDKRMSGKTPASSTSPREGERERERERGEEEGERGRKKKDEEEKEVKSKKNNEIDGRRGRVNL